MAEQHSPSVTPGRKSVLPRLLLLALLLLVVAVAVNFKDIRAIAAGEKTLKSVLYGKKIYPMKPEYSFPEPMGPKDAKVKAIVVAQEGFDCHQPLVVMWMAIATLEPKRLRVEFTDMSKLSQQTQEKMGVSCSAMVSINGNTKFEVGKGKNKRTIYLTGPTPGPDTPMPKAPLQPTYGPHGPHGWSMADVAEILNKYIEKAYKQKGNLTSEAIKAQIPVVSPQLPKPNTGKERAYKGA